ncbi:MAG: TIGR01458 family HAD-type hydrolase [Myxococcales bacterium]
MGERSIDGLLIDLDGVLYVGDRVIDGARETIAKLERQGVPHCYVTNTTTRPRDALVAKLGGMGFAVDREHILTAPMAAREYLEARGRPRVKLLLGEAVRGEFDGFEQAESDVGAVLVGDIGAAWDYELLNRVFRLVMDGAELIALHHNKFFQAEDGLRLDIGAFVAGLEYVTGKQATVIGKPNAAFFEAGLKNLGLPAARAAMVGDDIDNDVSGAQRAGLAGILVHTGKYRRDYAEASGVTPDLELESLAELPV